MVQSELVRNSSTKLYELLAEYDQFVPVREFDDRSRSNDVNEAMAVKRMAGDKALVQQVDVAITGQGVSTGETVGNQERTNETKQERGDFFDGFDG